MNNPINSDNKTSRLFGRRRKGDQKEQMRQLMLNAASELFIEQGYNAFSMRKLAEKIGYAPATLYLYFTDKDQLLFCVVDDAFTRFRNDLAQAAESVSDPWERLGRIGDAYIRFGLTHPAYYQLMFMWRVDYLLQARHGEEAPRMEAFQVLLDAVKYAQNLGAIKSGEAQAYSDLLWATMHGIVALAIQIPAFSEERIAKLTAQAKEMLYLALKP
ncbi:TetR/AcrR family transcriptional regulator [Calidifontibacillus erzurumensis]|uniref:TetR/AcrR family transcriptional regulator n=1 Tax=Calidifontibacillus erzurumensis TaxID=2741433 RepID=A0A8J8KC04_9BACI|nr:TetR/AcrR family transcriptional regulator [Calidifontibacillus erzurumensis]NSL51563.1 TetR/AcrR family transcriptional regulator [Calidifontibacillus erzurumensis]